MDAKVEEKKRTGRPPSRKHLLTLRLEPEIVEFFRGYGPGWLQRVNDTLKGQLAVLQPERDQVAASLKAEKERVLALQKREQRLEKKRQWAKARREAIRAARAA